MRTVFGNLRIDSIYIKVYEAYSIKYDCTNLKLNGSLRKTLSLFSVLVSCV